MITLRKVLPLIAILSGAVAYKAVLLALGAVPFNADEAVVALMARHIVQGERPWFFYGQAYMGSLDAYLIAGAFRVLGERVLTVRLVQMALFAAVLVTGYSATLRLTGDRRRALVVVLLLAFPPVLLTLYTTATLGGYGEALLAGNLLIWWGYRLGRPETGLGAAAGWGYRLGRPETGLGAAVWWGHRLGRPETGLGAAVWRGHRLGRPQTGLGAAAGWGHRLGGEDARRWGRWLAWGLVAGLGFWAFGLVLVYLVPVALWLVGRLRARAWRGYLLAAAGFVVGSLPWWLGNLGRLGVGVAELAGVAVRSTATAGSFLGNVGARTFNFVVLGLPAFFGLRFPWSVAGPPLWLAVPALALYLGALAYALRSPSTRSSSTPSSSTHSSPSPPSPRPLLWGVCLALFLGFVLTPFGGDPSGRYFLPLYLPLFIFTADALVALAERIRRWAWVLLGAVLAFNLVGTAQAALHNPPGITTQFEAITQVEHRYDGALMDLLRAHGGTRGYANYWVTYPIAFLSGEEIILEPRLPYKADLRYTPRDDRYAPYREWVEASPTVVYVTTHHPLLDGLLRGRFAALGVSFREAQIGDYHVFYDLSRKIVPGELNLPIEE